MKRGLFILAILLAVVISISFLPKRTFDIKREIKRVEKIFESPKEKPTDILFVGDMMFDRGVMNKIKSRGFDVLFLNIKNIFEGKDLVVGNLEGTITNNESIAVPNGGTLKFTFDPSVLKFLKKYNFGLLSSANNHSLDFEEAGYFETKQNLKTAGILSFGSPMNNDDLSQEIVLNDKNFCFIGYHDLYTKNELPVIEEIKKIKEDCYKIIVYPHWGEEYLNIFTERQKVLAHEFIDAGADLVVGTHPHVVEPIEIYKNKAIFYSIGNFVFDQYFSFETEHSIALNVIFREKETEFNFVPIEIKLGIVSLSEEDSAYKTLSALITENQTEQQKKDILGDRKLILID